MMAVDLAPSYFLWEHLNAKVFKYTRKSSDYILLKYLKDQVFKRWP